MNEGSRERKKERDDCKQNRDQRRPTSKEPQVTQEIHQTSSSQQANTDSQPTNIASSSNQQEFIYFDVETHVPNSQWNVQEIVRSNAISTDSKKPINPCLQYSIPASLNPEAPCPDTIINKDDPQNVPFNRYFVYPTATIPKSKETEVISCIEEKTSEGNNSSAQCASKDKDSDGTNTSKRAGENSYLETDTPKRRRKSSKNKSIKSVLIDHHGHRKKYKSSQTDHSVSFTDDIGATSRTWNVEIEKYTLAKSNYKEPSTSSSRTGHGNADGTNEIKVKPKQVSSLPSDSHSVGLNSIGETTVTSKRNNLNSHKNDITSKEINEDSLKKESILCPTNPLTTSSSDHKAMCMTKTSLPLQETPRNVPDNTKETKNTKKKRSPPSLKRAKDLSSEDNETQVRLKETSSLHPSPEVLPDNVNKTKVTSTTSPQLHKISEIPLRYENETNTVSKNTPSTSSKSYAIIPKEEKETDISFKEAAKHNETKANTTKTYLSRKSKEIIVPDVNKRKASLNETSSLLAQNDDAGLKIKLGMKKSSPEIQAAVPSENETNRVYRLSTEDTCPKEANPTGSSEIPFVHKDIVCFEAIRMEAAPTRGSMGVARNVIESVDTKQYSDDNEPEYRPFRRISIRPRFSPKDSRAVRESVKQRRRKSFAKLTQDFCGLGMQGGYDDWIAKPTQESIPCFEKCFKLVEVEDPPMEMRASAYEPQIHAEVVKNLYQSEPEFLEQLKLELASAKAIKPYADKHLIEEIRVKREEVLRSEDYKPVMYMSSSTNTPQKNLIDKAIGSGLFYEDMIDQKEKDGIKDQSVVRRKGFCAPCGRYLVYFGVVLFSLELIMGLILMAVGLSFLIHKATLLLVLVPFTFLISIVVFISNGTLLIIASICGFCGLLESRNFFLIIHMVMAAIMAIVLLANAFLQAGYQVTTESRAEYRMQKSMPSVTQNHDTTVTVAWDVLQRSLHCCGIHGYLDWCTEDKDTFVTTERLDNTSANGTVKSRIFEEFVADYDNSFNYTDCHILPGCCLDNEDIMKVTECTRHPTPYNVYTMGCRKPVTIVLSYAGVIYNWTCIGGAIIACSSSVVALLLYMYYKDERRYRNRELLVVS
ncbi:uncharacterized protein [Periplaneta americana]|uniref:uncharacterized protein n=1 Tax=Periplaneta americana TaxID=6978 RepID=UPI0037E97375